MGVVGEGESEVTDVVNGVFRLHHGTQGDGLYELLHACALGVVHELVERTGGLRCGAGSLQLIAEAHHEGAQLLELLRVGTLVDAIGQRLGFLATLGLSDILGHGAVGEQHELLDELVGIALALEVGACGTAVGIDVEVQFLALELHRPVLEPLGTELLGQHVE